MYRYGTNGNTSHYLAVMSKLQTQKSNKTIVFFPISWGQIDAAAIKADLLCILQRVLTQFWDDPNTCWEAVRGNVIVE